MYRLVVLLAVAAVCFGQQQCDQAPVGDETVEEAIPIASFNTSGNDRIRSTWCIAHCTERISIIATMRFKPSSSKSNTYKMKKVFKSDGSLERIIDGKRENKDDPFNFCLDPFISAVVDAVSNKYNDTTSIAQQLNLTINKPGWAYLVYQLGPPPSIIATDNVHSDKDFCEKLVNRQVGNNFLQFQIFAGMVWDN
uniref:Uncharacterized protein n=1 Tax=Plectus sambesii TaxID=2011161 RepID=A0A914WU06_9BILA